MNTLGVVQRWIKVRTADDYRYSRLLCRYAFSGPGGPERTRNTAESSRLAYRPLPGC